VLSDDLSPKRRVGILSDLHRTYNFHLLCVWTVGQEIRDRFSGAVEAFARRNGSTSNNNQHGEHSRRKALEEPLVVVSNIPFFFFFLFW
jgi:hypothetical protein